VIPLEKDKLYRVVTGLYSAQMLGAVNAKSFGLLAVTPKDAEGNVIDDFEEYIVKNPNGSEVKEWYALASYLDSLDQVPDEYAQDQGRKVVTHSWNPIELVKSPNWITLLVLLILVVLILVIVLVIRAIVVRKSSRRYGRGFYGSSTQAYRGRKRKR
jgi:hypothetical protein